MVTPEDNQFHPRTDSPYWNESAWFHLPIPEFDMDGWIYFWHRPNMNLSCGGAAFYDATGEDTYNCRFFHVDEHQALPKGADMHDFTLDNGLTVETVEPLRAYRFAFKSEHCELDAEWSALMDPYEMKPPSAEMIKALGLERIMASASVNPGTNPGLEGFGKGHYECAGHMRGTVTISGQTYEVDGPSLRDHSWGPRRAYVGMPRGGWTAAIASEEHSFFCMAISLLPLDKDPIVGTTEHVIHGWYTRDGVQSQLVSGTRRVIERGTDGRPLRVVIEGQDALGRELQVAGRLRTLLKLPWTSVLFAWVCLVDWEFDGKTVPGPDWDYFPTTRRDRRFPQYNKLANV